MLKRFMELYTGAEKSDEDIEEFRKGNSWVELRIDTLDRLLKQIEEDFPMCDYCHNNVADILTEGIVLPEKLCTECRGRLHRGEITWGHIHGRIKESHVSR